MDQIYLYRKVDQTWYATIPNYRSVNIEHIKIYFINFRAMHLKIWIFHHLNQFLENLYLRKPTENARSTQIHTCRGADRRDARVVSPRVSHAALRPTSAGRLSPTVRSSVARRAPTPELGADRARTEGCLGFAGARQPQRANKRRERGSGREDSRGPRARRSSGHVAAVKSHLIPWRGRPRACARDCACRGGARGGFNRAWVVGYS